MSKRLSDEIKAVEQLLSAWLDQNQNAEFVRQTEALPLRRDVESLLIFVRDNKVVGTPANNMPMKAVREVAALFVNPPELEIVIGKNVYPHRSEEQVWPVNFVRILAEVGGLLKIGAGRRWRLTRKGEKFLGEPPLEQLIFLLTTWWFKVNWVIAFPYEGMGDKLPETFSLFTLHTLRILPAKARIPFDEFADGLIKATGLRWGKRPIPNAQSYLRNSIERMVVNMLSDFGAIEGEYREEALYKITISKLVAFAITLLGKLLLETVAMFIKSIP